MKCEKCGFEDTIAMGKNVGEASDVLSSQMKDILKSSVKDIVIELNENGLNGLHCPAEHFASGNGIIFVWGKIDD